MVVVLFALSPAVQGYHLGRSEADTTCVTRALIAFCKDEHARLARESAAREAKEQTNECATIAREAEEGKRRLNTGNYYLRCLPPSEQARLLAKWGAEERRERQQEASQRTQAASAEAAEHAKERSQLEGEAEALKAKAKQLTEEHERLDNEGKYSLGLERSSEADTAHSEAEKKLEQAHKVG